MEPYVYLAPRSLSEAYAALGNGKRTAMLAGGTDIIVQMREGRKSADQVLDLKYIPELMAMGFLPDGTLELGAATSCAVIYEDAEVARRLPGLVDAASLIGSIQIQSRASIGGNICNAGPAADSAPALIALSAIAVIGSASGTRELPIHEFFTGVGRNALQPGELLLQIRIPALPARAQSFYLRFIPRNEMDIAVVGAGAMLQLDESGERIEAARFGLGAVAPTPLLVPGAADAIIGKAPTRETFELAGDAAAAAATPITDMRGSIAQRKHLSKVLTVRALEGALARIRGGN
ncbi:MAG: FAD binding domain-containing protein [Tepidiformaceae bacterium]